MKKDILCLAGVVLLLSGLAPRSESSAVPTARSNLGREYLISTDELRPWSCGLYTTSYDRNVNSLRMRSSKYMGYVGYDFIPWITTYVTFGSHESRYAMDPGESAGEYGLGASFNIIDQEILDPTLFEDRIRLNGNIQYTLSSIRWSGQDTDWNELYASLTLSIVNDLQGDKFFTPNSLALFIGPIYCAPVDTELTVDKTLGFTAGIDCFLNEKITLELGFQQLKNAGITAGISIRF